MIRKLSLENGKYTFEYNEEAGTLRCLRNGETWREFIGDKAVYALFMEALKAPFLERQVDDMRSLIDNLEDQLEMRDEERMEEDL